MPVSRFAGAQEKQRCPSHKNNMTAKLTKVARSLQRGQRLLSFVFFYKCKPSPSLKDSFAEAFQASLLVQHLEGRKKAAYNP